MQKDRQAGQCGMESVPGTVMAAAAKFAGLREWWWTPPQQALSGSMARTAVEVCGLAGFSRKKAHVGLPWGLYEILFLEAFYRGLTFNLNM